MKKLKMMLFALCMFPVGNASANAYFGVDLMLLTLELTSPAVIGTTEAEPTALGFKIGVDLNRNLAVEGLLGVSLSDDQFDASTLEAELDSLFGFYAVGKFPLSNAGEVYGKAGFVTLEYEDSDGDKLDGSGLSFGFGARFHLNRQLSVGGEFLFFPDTEYDDSVFGFPVDGESDSLNIGMQLRF